MDGIRAAAEGVPRRSRQLRMLVGLVALSLAGSLADAQATGKGHISHTKHLHAGHTAKEGWVQHKDVIKVACIGDSITYGDGTLPQEVKHHDGGVRLTDPSATVEAEVTAPMHGHRLRRAWRGSYPQHLQDLLANKADIGMFALGGVTGMLSAHDERKGACERDEIHENGCGIRDTSAFRAAMDYNADVVVLMLGTNDAKQTPATLNNFFIDDMKALLKDVTSSMDSDALGADSQAHRRILVLPPTVHAEKFMIDPTVMETVIRPKLVELAEDAGWDTLDVQKVLDDNVKEYFGNTPYEEPFEKNGDGVHPTAAGANRIALEVSKKIEAVIDEITIEFLKKLTMDG